MPGKNTKSTPKTGRPYTKAPRKKGITISVSEEEEQIIKDKAAEFHLNRAQYLYMCLGKLGVFDPDKKLPWEQ